MATTSNRDPELEWLDHVQPIGLVVAPSVLKEFGLFPLRQGPLDSGAVAELLAPDGSGPALPDVWAFAEAILGWDARYVAGAPGGPPLPSELAVSLPEHATTLEPSWAVAELDDNGEPWQLLVRIEATGVDPDVRGALDGWEATPHQRFERLLRDTGVFGGILVTDHAIRLIYAPSGETSGHLTFPIRPLGTVAGRPMLGGLKLLLDRSSLFTAADTHRLSALMKRSRDAQAAVSTALAEQVLGALHELLRGLDSADSALIRELALSHSDRLYEGLLAVLMRLVFVLYAEDRDLLPSLAEGRAREIYETSYSVRGLYATLVEDAALNPDTMDERRGGWGRLLALFRLIHRGHPTGFIQARGGKLFDPDEFPFLEGRAGRGAPPRVLTVSDGCLLRILEGLMTLKVRGGERERLSYRALDVEQIGSVYEGVMGFTARIAGGRVLAIRAGKNNRTPVFVVLDELLAKKGKDRIKDLKENAGRGQISAAVTKAIETAGSVEELTAALDSIVDERGSPRHTVAPAGSPILQPTDERRRTGGHYTPRSLTAPIVRHALEPAFARLGEDAAAEQILDLKICDPAMGSGAFLVEACRLIGERLVAAWDRHPETRPEIPADEDGQLHARRLVAQRCLYGVDKNPRAVDLARLSLWLATLARDHEFTFLDHALKCGDSLVGLTREQISSLHWDANRGLPLFSSLVRERFEAAVSGRREIREAPDDVSRAVQEARYGRVEERLDHVRLIGNAIVAAFFSADKPRARERKRQEIESGANGAAADMWPRLEELVDALRWQERPIIPFHWEIEFPEVFARENGGFDAVVGNPPFLGGTRISTENGPCYLSYLLSKYAGGDRTDLIGYFLLRVAELIGAVGSFGLIATNTIAQGDTRRVLRKLIEDGGQLYRAVRRLAWPGDAAVIVSVLHFSKSKLIKRVEIDDRPVKRISAYLKDMQLDEEPKRLQENMGIAFEGFAPYGPGFLFADDGSAYSSLDEMRHLISKSSKNNEVIFKYIGGEDILDNPESDSKRYAIYIGQMPEKEFLSRFPDLFQIVFEKVRPERLSKSARVANLPWWQFLWPRPRLFAKMQTLQRVIIRPKVTKHHSFVVKESKNLYSNLNAVICWPEWSGFVCLQARINELWARVFSSSLKDDLRYTPSDSFEPFPFPPQFATSAILEALGENYHAHRATLMAARGEGATKTYNRFHDRNETASDIVHLRELHAAMDRAVLEAYGWHDLAERAAPIFLDEANEDDHTYQGRLFWPSEFRDEVLDRLLALNAERHAEEVRRGVAPGMKDGQYEAEDDEEGVDAELTE